MNSIPYCLEATFGANQIETLFILIYSSRVENVPIFIAIIQER